MASDGIQNKSSYESVCSLPRIYLGRQATMENTARIIKAGQSQGRITPYDKGSIATLQERNNTIKPTLRPYLFHCFGSSYMNPLFFLIEVESLRVI